MQKISIKEPAEMLATLPYQLGFHPRRSVVVVGFVGKQIHLVARLDVTPDPAQATGVAEGLVDAMLRAHLDGAMVVGYEDVRGESQVLSEALAEEVEDAGIDLVDRLVVHEGRWNGLMCSCCRDKPVPAAPDVPAVADFVALGRTALASREDLGRLVAPDDDRPEDLLAAVRARLTEAPHGRDRPWDERCIAAWADLVEGRHDRDLIPIEDLSVLLASLRDRSLRDGLLAALCPGSLPSDAVDPRLVPLLSRRLGLARPDHLDEAGPTPGERPAGGALGSLLQLPRAVPYPDLVESRLARLCRLAPDEHAAPVLTVMATHAWWSGNGAVARFAVERALELEPDHVLARLVLHLLDLGVRADRDAA